MPHEEHVCIGCGKHVTSHPSQICDKCTRQLHKQGECCVQCGSWLKHSPYGLICTRCAKEVTEEE
jgi:predicted amidophosphoribosyltransferase